LTPGVDAAFEADGRVTTADNPEAQSTEPKAGGVS
jgi:hypothetical protein